MNIYSEVLQVNKKNLNKRMIPHTAGRISGQPIKIYCSKRRIFIPKLSQKAKVRRRNIAKKKADSIEQLDPEIIMRIKDPFELELKVKQLREFTNKVRNDILNNQETQKADLVKDYNIESTEDEADLIYQGFKKEQLLSKNSKSDLKFVESAAKNSDLSKFILEASGNMANKFVPKDIQDIVKNDELIIRSFNRKGHEDWNALINEISKNENLITQLSESTLKQWLAANVANLTLPNIEALDKLYLAVGNNNAAKFEPYMFHSLFRNLSHLQPLFTPQNNHIEDDPVIIKLKELLDRYEIVEKHDQISNLALNCCITYAAKLKDIKIMDYFLRRFRDSYGISPNKENFTKIIEFYENMNLREKAWNIFDTMKFLSKSHGPDEVTYNLMIRICEKDKNYAKAIDLYHEMKDHNIEPQPQTYNLMGRVLARCSANNVIAEGNSEALRLVGWKFVSEIMNKDDYSNVATMMSLAAYDGDIAVSRALYFNYSMGQYRRIKGTMDDKLAWQKCLDPKLFNYLLLSYSNFKPQKVPLLLGWERGIKLRRDLLNSVDYTPRGNEDCPISLPLLPIIELNDPNLILLESAALWDFHLNSGSLNDSYRNYKKDEVNINLESIIQTSKTFNDFKMAMLKNLQDLSNRSINKRILTPMCIGSYLNIAIKLDDKDQFLSRLKNFTFQQFELDNALTNIINEHSLLNESSDIDTKSTNQLTTSENNGDKLNIASFKHKLLMTCSMYEIAMKAAIKFNDIKLAQGIWEDRGKFRKTKVFANLDLNERIYRDSTFAKLMVDFFARQGRYTDALSIVLSSKNYINWKYSMVKNLHKGLIELEDNDSISVLLKIVNKKKSPLEHINQQIKELSVYDSRL